MLELSQLLAQILLQILVQLLAQILSYISLLLVTPWIDQEHRTLIIQLVPRKKLKLRVTSLPTTPLQHFSTTTLQYYNTTVLQHYSTTALKMMSAHSYSSSKGLSSFFFFKRLSYQWSQPGPELDQLANKTDKYGTFYQISYIVHVDSVRWITKTMF